jgi:GNAT superfamily N-acetyltransferase
MRDLLVALPVAHRLDRSLASVRRSGVQVRRATQAQMKTVTRWVEQEFSAQWRKECRRSFDADRPRCVVAWRRRKPVAFACFDAMRKGLFGPIGVSKAERGHGVGRLVLLYALETMRREGYEYVAIGAVGDAAIGFYARSAGAVVIAGSEARARARVRAARESKARRAG